MPNMRNHHSTRLLLVQKRATLKTVYTMLHLPGVTAARTPHAQLLISPPPTRTDTRAKICGNCHSTKKPISSQFSQHRICTTCTQKFPNANEAIQARLACLLKHFTNIPTSFLNVDSLSTLAAQFAISRIIPSPATAHAVAHIYHHPPTRPPLSSRPI